MAVFPIGVGDRYDEAQLRILAGPGASSNVVKLQQVEDLLTMVTPGNSFFHRLCSGESSDIFLFQFSNNRYRRDHYQTRKPIKTKLPLQRLKDTCIENLVLNEDCHMDQNFYISVCEGTHCHL